MSEDEYLAPEWASACRVHDWRNYVGEMTRALWGTFSEEQKRAIALDADGMASTENWDNYTD